MMKSNFPCSRTNALCLTGNRQRRLTLAQIWNTFQNKSLLKEERNVLRTFVTVVFCVIITCFSFSGHVQAGTIYEYIDKDGSSVLTDSPPPGVKARPLQTFRDMTDADKQALEKEKSEEMQKYRQSDITRKEKEEKIRAAREEYEQAIKNEERYKSNKNQSRGFAQQKHWNNMIEEQNKEIEEKRKKLQELESAP